MPKMTGAGFPCWIEGCSHLIRASGLCFTHYGQWKRTKTTVLKPCACGCGELVVERFVYGHHMRTLSSEEQRRRGLKGGVSRQRGYGVKREGYVKYRGRHEHRIVAEIMLGRALRRGEIVHHKNGNAKDNRACNLEVMTQAEHARQHALERRKNKKA